MPWIAQADELLLNTVETDPALFKLLTDTPAYSDSYPLTNEANRTIPRMFRCDVHIGGSTIDHDADHPSPDSQAWVNGLLYMHNPGYFSYGCHYRRDKKRLEVRVYFINRPLSENVDRLCKRPPPTPGSRATIRHALQVVLSGEVAQRRAPYGKADMVPFHREQVLPYAIPCQ